ncbi:alpha/beta fold hydrolase [Streptomyces albipurpureus]|uniref:Alpha/beta hydrolase n=1 Tax=Streptomyces albipurpureus TaxID=2897419 RepID=A0ABT0UFY9_9ACTN|nr:alpha/beta hydrolase [Streptomyces sp. CWNU-1]MCM2387544.1 alpha/beta hydrolase [Streptomyces sp. CWNU-1]
MEEFTYIASEGTPLHAVALGTAASTIVLLHGGGPDHRSLLPLAERLTAQHTVVLPDVRGYGRSWCADPARHTWAQYTADLIALLDHLGEARAVVGGTGLGSTITLRAALAHPDRIRAGILIGVEDIEDDDAKERETAFLDDFAERVTSQGLEAAWAPVLSMFPPIIGAAVRAAIPRSDPPSIAAAASIGRDRAFRDVTDLSDLRSPVLVIPGTDARHPTALAEQVARTLPHGRLAPVAVSESLHTTEDLARVVAPPIQDFLSATDT